jgi:LysM repeat protein
VLNINGGAAAAAAAKTTPKQYRVRKGDTLAEIAEKFGTTVDVLRTKNKSLRRSTALRAGQVIRLQ